MENNFPNLTSYGHMWIVEVGEQREIASVCRTDELTRSRCDLSDVDSCWTWRAFTVLMKYRSKYRGASSGNFHYLCALSKVHHLIIELEEALLELWITSLTLQVSQAKQFGARISIQLRLHICNFSVKSKHNKRSYMLTVLPHVGTSYVAFWY